MPSPIHFSYSIEKIQQLVGAGRTSIFLKPSSNASERSPTVDADRACSVAEATRAGLGFPSMLCDVLRVVPSGRNLSSHWRYDIANITTATQTEPGAGFLRLWFPRLAMTDKIICDMYSAPTIAEAPMITLKVNGEQHSLDVEAEMPLLWALRNEIGLTGTKFGCGVAQCGACTVLLDGRPVRSCMLAVSAVQAREITTIEGLSDNGTLTKVQEAWIAEDVPQCGYCQSGQILSATALLRHTPNPDDSDIDAAMAGNICRCGTYVRIRRAIHRAAAKV
jgi:aerobic-type carbon monoxide dehydrogenase small subunit (CoxS/CutS family)